jgi:hypothetical protein
MKGRKGLVVLIFLLALSPFQCGKKATVPEDLIGVWKTTAAPYDDRFFEIKADEVIFGTGEGNFDTYAITKIKTEKDPREQATLYTLCYKTIERREYRFSFYYDPANHGSIRFKNQQEMVWTKEKAKDEKSDDQNS